MIPSFAVVGHPNKGKSSIVATLAEDDSIAIGPVPGTTRRSRTLSLEVGGQVRYRLTDTPGFQRAREVLTWLEAQAGDASDRPEAVRRFVAAHESDARFADECELLKPILSGAGIIYVVDGAKPYGVEFELEMQILRWTGQPRMALINLIGEGDFQEEWQRALDQYFSIVRVFDAMHADFPTRLGLLQAFGELNADWRQPLGEAIDALRDERRRRRWRSAEALADLAMHVLTHVEEAPLQADREAQQAALTRKLTGRLARREAQARDVVQTIYRHGTVAREEVALDFTQVDLFTDEGWQIFGLSRQSLLLSGMATGAVAGGGVDLLLGGASLLLGTMVGTVIGGVTAWFGGEELAKVRVLGEPLGGEVLQVGPVAAPNFPWVLLGRGWLHHHVVSERNHARREAISLAAGQAQNLMDRVGRDLQKELALCIKDAREGTVSRERFVQAVDELLAVDPLKSDDPLLPVSQPKQGDAREATH